MENPMLMEQFQFFTNQRPRTKNCNVLSKNVGSTDCSDHFVNRANWLTQGVHSIRSVIFIHTLTMTSVMQSRSWLYMKGGSWFPVQCCASTDSTWMYTIHYATSVVNGNEFHWEHCFHTPGFDHWLTLYFADGCVLNRNTLQYKQVILAVCTPVLVPHCPADTVGMRGIPSQNFRVACLRCAKTRSWHKSNTGEGVWFRIPLMDPLVALIRMTSYVQ